MKKKNIMLIHHNGGGGIEHFLRSNQQGSGSVVAELYATHQGLQIKCESNENPTQIEYNQLANMIKEKQISELHLHQLWNMQLKEVVSLIQTAKITYRVWLHDFYAVCPFIFFVNQKGRYCGMPSDEATCDRCAARGAKYMQMKHMLKEDPPSIKSWRNIFNDLLSGANQVIAPSESAKSTVLTYFPTVKITVIPHPMHLSASPVLPRKSRRLNIAIIGDIFYHKGEKEAAELIQQSNKRNISCHFSLFGKAGRTLTNIDTTTFTRYGAYQSPADLTHLLRDAKIDLILIPSICPETFSYTTHEAIKLGYPVLCFDLGAQAEAVRQTGCGWVVPAVNTRALIQKVEELSMNLDEVYQMKLKAYEYQQKCD